MTLYAVQTHRPCDEHHTYKMNSSAILLLVQVLFLAIWAEDPKAIVIEDMTDTVLDERAKKHEFVLAFLCKYLADSL